MAKVLQQSDGLISFDISINGTRIKDVIEIFEISVQKEVNRITSARLDILDGGTVGAVNEPFTNSEGTDFIPGNEIEISLGYDNKKKSVFKGIITSQRLKVKHGKSLLSIRCKDKAVHMTHGRFNGIYKHIEDSDVIKKIVAKYGLQLNMEDTSTTQPILMQYNCTDWDFVVTRAELNNRCVLTDNNCLIVKKIDFSETASCEINASQYVIDIDLRLESEYIADSYQLTAWNDKEQRENEVNVSINDDLSQGNLSAEKLSKAFNSGTMHTYSAASLSEAELKMWGTTLANKAVLSKIQGSIVVPGTADIKAGDMINISGFGSDLMEKPLCQR